MTRQGRTFIWAALDDAIQLLVSMDAISRTRKIGEGGSGKKDNGVKGTYGRDTLNDDGENYYS